MLPWPRSIGFLTFGVNQSREYMRIAAGFILLLALSGCYALKGGDENDPCRRAAVLVMEREDLRQDFDSQADYYRQREVQRKLNENQRKLDAADAACEKKRAEERSNS